MSLSFIALLSLLHTSIHAADVSCPIVLDGRIPTTATLSLFDTPSSPFSTEYVKGENLKFSQILQLPQIPLSRFDSPNYQPVEITINDKSIFKPGSGASQTGFRRAGLIPAANNGTDASTVGIKTFHWSVKQNTVRTLNVSHEYLNVWHERNDYNGNQFSFQTGAFIGRESASEKNHWKVADKNGKVVFSTHVEKGWQNFAITLDYVKNTIQVYYSADDVALKAVTGLLPNDNAGGGQLQVGILKKPTGGDPDVVHVGFQEKNFEESLIYGSVFVEDSARGCVSK